MMLNKKSEMGVMIQVILIIIIAAILIGLFAKIYLETRNLNAIEKCRLSVLAKEKISQLASAGTRVFDSPTKLECYANYIDVTPKKIYKNQNKQSAFPYTEDNLNKILAMEMYDCWYQFGQGRIKPFTAGKRCVICAQITFDSDFQTQNPKILGFDEYLENTKIPRTETTYLDYLTNKQSGKILNPSPQGTQTKLEIDTTRQYYILYVSSVSNTLEEAGKQYIFSALIGSIMGPTGTIAGAAIGIQSAMTTMSTYKTEAGLYGVQGIQLLTAQEAAQSCGTFY